MSDALTLRYQNGMFRCEQGSLGLFPADAAAKQARADDMFIALLRATKDQGRNVSASQSPTYAPSVFSAAPQAKEAKIDIKAFAAAMARLFEAKKIVVVTEGPPSRQRSHIEEVRP